MRGWQVATNTGVTGRSPQQLRTACGRFDRAWATLARGGGYLSVGESMALLSALAMNDTLVTASSSVFDLTARELHLVVGRRYGEEHRFQLARMQ